MKRWSERCLETKTIRRVRLENINLINYYSFGYQILSVHFYLSYLLCVQIWDSLNLGVRSYKNFSNQSFHEDYNITSSSKITTSPLAIFIKISLSDNQLKTYRTMLTNLYTNQKNYCILDFIDAVYFIYNLHTLKNIQIINKYVKVFWSLWNVVVGWLWTCFFFSGSPLHRTLWRNSLLLHVLLGQSGQQREQSQIFPPKQWYKIIT